jgi:hypothetical protein
MRQAIKRAGTNDRDTVHGSRINARCCGETQIGLAKRIEGYGQAPRCRTGQSGEHIGGHGQ